MSSAVSIVHNETTALSTIKIKIDDANTDKVRKTNRMDIVDTFASSYIDLNIPNLSFREIKENYRKNNC